MSDSHETTAPARRRSGAPPVQERRGRLSRFFRDARVEMTIAALIVLSVALLLAESILPASDPWQPALLCAGEVLTLVFVLELVLRYLAHPHAGEFLGEYWLDIVAVAPLFRPLRFLRFLRLLRLFRAGLVLHRQSRQLLGTLAETGGEYILLTIFLATAVFLGAIGIMQTEGHRSEEFNTFGSALWWTVLSMATGQPTQTLPGSNLGKLLALFVILCGATVFAMFTGIVSAVMVERMRRHMDERNLGIDELAGHILLCGWNWSANIMLQQIQRDPRHVRTPIVVIAEFSCDETIDFTGLRRELIYIVRGDFTKVAVLGQANVKRAAVAILLADQVVRRSDQDRDARTVLAALTIEKLAPGVFTCVELLNAENEGHLRMAGVEEVVVPDVLQADILALACLNRGLGGMFRELFENARGTSFYTCPVPPSWDGVQLAQVFGGIKQTLNAVVVGVKSGQRVESNPPLELRLASGDFLVVVAGQQPDLETLRLPPRKDAA
ncbi:MAG: ion transporter [Candidatus Riflebacteria bacterium]|nr:ion transporter [Candidatus Riflebacteria bacterium]